MGKFNTYEYFYKTFWSTACRNLILYFIFSSFLYQMCDLTHATYVQRSEHAVVFPRIQKALGRTVLMNMCLNIRVSCACFSVRVTLQPVGWDVIKSRAAVVKSPKQILLLHHRKLLLLLSTLIKKKKIMPFFISYICSLTSINIRLHSLKQTKTDQKQQTSCVHSNSLMSFSKQKTFSTICTWREDDKST